MSPKDKYINFIVDDLVKGTKIDYDLQRIRFPFFKGEENYVFFFTLKQIVNGEWLPYDIYYDYVYLKYGVSLNPKDKDVDIIWDRFMNKVYDIITGSDIISESMTPKEKYHRYIVNDLLKGTMFWFEDNEPWYNHLILPKNLRGDNHRTMISVYGLKDNDEAREVIDLYGDVVNKYFIDKFGEAGHLEDFDEFELKTTYYLGDFIKY